MAAPFDDQGFWAAFVVGIASCLAAIVAQQRGIRIGFGPPLIVASGFGLVIADLPSTRLLLGVAALWTGGQLASRHPLWVQAAAIIPGALLLAWAAPAPVPAWMRTFIGIGVVATAPLVGAFDAHNPRVTPLLLLLTVGGVCSTVPDTEIPFTLLGAFGAMSILSLDRATRPSPGGAAAATGLVFWMASAGGYGRPGSVIGAVACLGVLVLLPLPFVGGRRPVSSTREVTIVLAAQLGLVVVAARVAGLRETAAAAAAIVAIAFVAASSLLHVSLRSRTPR